MGHRRRRHADRGQFLPSQFNSHLLHGLVKLLTFLPISNLVSLSPCQLLHLDPQFLVFFPETIKSMVNRPQPFLLGLRGEKMNPDDNARSHRSESRNISADHSIQHDEWVMRMHFVFLMGNLRLHKCINHPRDLINGIHPIAWEQRMSHDPMDHHVQHQQPHVVGSDTVNPLIAGSRISLHSRRNIKMTRPNDRFHAHILGRHFTHARHQG